MMIKILQAYNYGRNFLQWKEENDLYYLINDHGELEQIKKVDFPLDHTIEMPMEEVYNVIPRNNGANRQLDALLKFSIQNTIAHISSLIGEEFQGLNGSTSCYLAPSKNIRLCSYFSSFDLKDENCFVEIYDYHLDFLKDGSHEIVLLALEEFGLLYLHGTRLRRLLQKTDFKKKNGKKVWTPNINYQGLLQLSGINESFHEYSDQIEYVKKIINNELEHNDFNDSNVLNFTSFKQAQEIFQKIKAKKTGHRLVSPSKNQQEARPSASSQKKKN